MLYKRPLYGELIYATKLRSVSAHISGSTECKVHSAGLMKEGVFYHHLGGGWLGPNSPAFQLCHVANSRLTGGNIDQ